MVTKICAGDYARVIYNHTKYIKLGLGVSPFLGPISTGLGIFSPENGLTLDGSRVNDP